MLTPDSLMNASSTALETMFFTSILEPVPADSASRVDMSYKLSFQGDQQGEFALGISNASAVSVAANFLGVEPEEVSDDEAQDVMRELTNMIAGSLLSSLESKNTFSLSHPERDDSEELRGRFQSADAQVFELEDGVLAVSLAV